MGASHLRKMAKFMKAAYLPGNSTVELREPREPEPGYGEVVFIDR